jgi:MFS family permease
MSQAAEQAAFIAWQALIPLAAGAVLLTGYAIHALRGPTPPLIDLRLFASRGFTASVTIMGLGGLANFATLFALPLYYQQAHGHGVLAAGLLMAPAGLGGAIAMPLAGRLSDRLGARGLASAGAIVAALSGLAFTQIGADTPELWPVLAAFTIGLGMGCFSAPTMGSLYRTLPTSMVAQGSSVLYMLNQLGAALGVALVTLILQTAADPVHGFHDVFWFAVAMIVVVLAAIPLLPGRPQVPAVEEELATSGRTS